MKVALVVREGNDEVSAEDRQKFQTLDEFDNVDLGTCQEVDQKDPPEQTGPVPNGQGVNSGKREWQEQNGVSDVQAGGGTKIPARKKQRTAKATSKAEDASTRRRSKRLKGSSV